MCDVCGCGDKSVAVDVHDRILAGNDRQAAHNREHFAESGVLAINLMGSPGAGKTGVLEATARGLTRVRRIGALTGDLATDNDANRLKAVGVPALSITTGSACHLDADMVHHALHHFPWKELDYLFIENVGNLVCPASFSLGTHKSVLIASIPEGDDKPHKYPGMYRGVDALVINKMDLLPYIPFRMDFFRQGVEALNPGVITFPLSCRTGEGLDAWTGWILDQVADFRKGRNR